nr:tRNA (cytosine(34)-C(5))-methyltransferase, mitochondrial isoform X2 [Camelus bactrianus]
MQCAYPGYLHCNEYDTLRLRWLRETLESFIPQPLVNVIKVSELDGREMGDAWPETFDKVLVDAPCSNDRSWLFSSDPQKAACRINQRRNLPVLQIELLRSAIKALRPGGLLVYSTCTLSKAENQDVISEILNSYSNIMPVDIKEMARTCSQDFTFAPTGQECGLLVIPDKGLNWLKQPDTVSTEVIFEPGEWFRRSLKWDLEHHSGVGCRLSQSSIFQKQRMLRWA